MELAFKKARYYEQSKKGDKRVNGNVKPVTHKGKISNLEGHIPSQEFKQILAHEEAVKPQELIQDEINISQQMAVSVHVIEGVQDNQTITLTGNKGKKQFSILIDGGSTHSFIDDKTANKLKCELVKTPAMKMLVANGNQLVSQYVCKQFSWKMGNHQFNTSIRTLRMGSYDLVLGVDLARLSWANYF